jgi:hypothetical protein
MHELRLDGLGSADTPGEDDALRALAPRLGVPVLLSFWGAFVDFLQILYDNLLTLSTSGKAQALGSLRPPLQLRWNDLGGYPYRRGDLWPHSRILLTCSGAVCFQNMEVRVLCESVSGQVAVKACGSASERPPIKGCNDVAVD